MCWACSQRCCCDSSTMCCSCSSGHEHSWTLGLLLELTISKFAQLLLCLLLVVLCSSPLMSCSRSCGQQWDGTCQRVKKGLNTEKRKSCSARDLVGSYLILTLSN